MSKSLALKASQRIRDVWSDWASDVGHFNSLWKIYKGGRLFRRRRFEEQVPGAHLANRFDLPNAVKKLSQLERYASTHHGAQQGEAARRSSDMRQARHLPQRWYWDIVVQRLKCRGIVVATRRFSKCLGKSVGNVRDSIDRDPIAYKHGDWASTVFSTEPTDFVPNLFT
ncbi:hypothetical protein TNCV_177941 [Trichonephila clavipes]|nr:hypothetical protein TNCV_177941 [Trichonephila clavipes]